MDLLVVRHAIAEEREDFARTGKDDAERPLTEVGRRKFERGARGLQRVAKSIDLLATSHLTRAIQTGDLLQEAFGIDAATRLRELAPDADPASFVRWLGGRGRHGVVAIVGHSPHLPRLVEHLLCADHGGFIDLKKGGACLLTLVGGRQVRRAELRWLLTASQLRRLAPPRR